MMTRYMIRSAIKNLQEREKHMFKLPKKSVKGVVLNFFCVLYMSRESCIIANLTIYFHYANFKLLPLFMSLKIDCFHCRRTVNICVAGLNRVAGYATVHDSSQIYYLGMKTAFFHSYYSLPRFQMFTRTNSERVYYFSVVHVVS